MMRRRASKLAALLLAPAMLLGVFGVGLATAAPNTGGTVHIQTVPAMAGVQLLVGGQPVTTGPGGAADVQVPDLNGIATKVSLGSNQPNPVDTVAITKVVPSPHTAKHESSLTVGLDVTSRVTLKLDSGLSGVSAGSVNQLGLHSVAGQTLTVDPQQTPSVSLLSRRTRLVGGTLTAQPVTWSVDSVKVAPGVSVTAKQPRFDPFNNPVWQLTLQPVSGTVVVDTVPAVAGVMFSLEGGTITTGAGGRGEGVVADLNGVADSISLATPAAGPSSVSVLRVVKQPPGAPYQRHLLVALAVRRSVQLSFTDASGRRVPPSRLSKVELSSGGTAVDLTGQAIGQPVSLLAQTATQDGKDWQMRQLTYSVSAVRLDGSNAVFPGRQRFNPNTTGNWAISLAVFNLKVAVHDVLFGMSVGSSASITRPDGTRYSVHLQAGPPTVLESLVRGNYDLRVKSAVLGGRNHLLVTRNDHVNLRVVTKLDVLVIFVLGVALCGGVLWLGIKLRRGPRRQPSNANTRSEEESRKANAQSEEESRKVNA